MNKAYPAKNDKGACIASGRDPGCCGWPPTQNSRYEMAPPKAAPNLADGPGSQAPAACSLRDLPGIESLIREGAALKDEIDGKTARLRQIHLKLAESARFENGKKTALLFGAGYRVKVRLYENIAWDQEKILKFREYVTEEKFGELFKAVYEPTSRKEIDGFISHADRELSNGLKWCMSIKPGAPQVTYEKLGDTESRFRT